MNKTLLAQAIRNNAETVLRIPDHEDKRDTVELLHVLARILNGQPVSRAFGAPGDWGYDTPIGSALAAAPEVPAAAAPGDPRASRPSEETTTCLAEVEKLLSEPLLTAAARRLLNLTADALRTGKWPDIDKFQRPA